MNHRQKLVQQQFLNDEGKVIKRLKSVYDQSMKDINGKISTLDSSIAELQKAYNSIDKQGVDDGVRAVSHELLGKKWYTPEEAKETLQSVIQSKVYQKKYQTALQKQVGDILDKMHTQQFNTVSEYLEQCYENGFIGTMFDLQGQGIPLCFPLDQEQMVRAVQLDSKIVEGYYQRMGKDVAMLKKRITAEVSRGISSGMRWQQIAQQLQNKTSIGYTNAIRIARTEGHRIQCQAGMDACYKAKDMGADVVKQWDSTLDARTRDSHAKLDGEIREIDEPFSNGLMFPGDPHGIAAEVINCRCALLERARWALGEAELKTLQDRAAFFGLDKTDTFDDYKRKYLNSAKPAEMRQFGEGATPPKEYDGVFDDFAQLNLTKSEAEALSTVWSKAKETGNEYGLVIENGVVSKPVTSGLTNGVSIPLDGYGKNLTLIHSHTNATPFSVADFKKLLDEKVDKIGVIGYNADAYIAYVGNGERPNIEEFIEVAKNIGEATNFDMLDHPDFYYWSVEERNYMAIREQAYRIVQHYGWTLEGGRIDV